jgi:RNA polymerase sigma-70 factor (ECF subfamily)
MDATPQSGAWMDPGEEAALVTRAQRGDRASFVTLVRFYDRSVFRIVYALCRDPDQAAEIAVETFMRAWKGVQHIPAGQTFYPWLTRLARGLAITHARRRTPTAERGRAPALRADVDPERARACEAAYAELGFDHQTILVLRVVERLTYAQIAKTLDIPFPTTLARLASARGALYARLTPPEEKAA